jgi:anti-sigma regulatory factor (Ser/Thr protein kinase)
MANLHITVPAYHAKIENLCILAGEAAIKAGFDDRTAYACQLAIGEACENIINHGYKEEGIGDIELSAETSPGKIILILRDSAPPFNPAVEPGPQHWKEEDPPVGGLGLLIIHRVMDKVTYSRIGGENILELHKADK